MAKEEVVLISNVDGRFTINFMGAFQNKWTKGKGGKLYLSEREFEFFKLNYPHLLENKTVSVLGQEKEESAKENDGEKDQDKNDQEIDPKEFFEQHTNKIKSQVKEMDNKDQIDKLLEYADENDITTKAVDALMDRYNELGE